MSNNYHFRRIPDYIEQELRSIDSQYVIAAAIINASKAEISRGAYRHLGIRIEDGELVSILRIYQVSMPAATVTASYGF